YLQLRSFLHQYIHQNHPVTDPARNPTQCLHSPLLGLFVLPLSPPPLVSHVFPPVPPCFHCLQMLTHPAPAPLTLYCNSRASTTYKKPNRKNTQNTCSRSTT